MCTCPTPLAAQRAAPPLPQDTNTPLLTAAGEGRTKLVEALLGAGADRTARNASGHTPLIAAAAGNFTEAVEALLGAAAAAGGAPALELEAAATGVRGGGGGLEHAMWVCMKAGA